MIKKLYDISLILFFIITLFIILYSESILIKIQDNTKYQNSLHHYNCCKIINFNNKKNYLNNYKQMKIKTPVCCGKSMTNDGEYTASRDTMIIRFRCSRCDRTHNEYKKKSK